MDSGTLHMHQPRKTDVPKCVLLSAFPNRFDLTTLLLVWQCQKWNIHTQGSKEKCQDASGLKAQYPYATHQESSACQCMSHLQQYKTLWLMTRSDKIDSKCRLKLTVVMLTAGAFSARLKLNLLTTIASIATASNRANWSPVESNCISWESG